MEYLLNSLIFLVAFFGMEGVAWFAHKYVMHGFLWHLHKDHHHKEQYGFFEKNDYFFLLFATPGIACLYFGMTAGFNAAFFVGLGITIYGFTYFFVHDLFIHQRFKWMRRSNALYFKAIRKAHKVHHKHLSKEDGECFGMLWVPIRYFKEAKKSLL